MTKCIVCFSPDDEDDEFDEAVVYATITRNVRCGIGIESNDLLEAI